MSRIIRKLLIIILFVAAEFSCQPEKHWVFIQNNTKHAIAISTITFDHIWCEHGDFYRCYDKNSYIEFEPEFITGETIPFPEKFIHRKKLSKKEKIEISRGWKPQIIRLEPGQMEYLIAFRSGEITVDIDLIKKYFFMLTIYDKKGTIIKQLDDFNQSNLKKKFTMPFPLSNEKSILHVE